MWSRAFWRDTAERSIATAAQAATAVLGADAFNIVQVDVLDVAGIAAGAGVVAVLKALVASQVGEKGTPSFVQEDEQ